MNENGSHSQRFFTYEKTSVNSHKTFYECGRYYQKNTTGQTILQNREK